ncbi:MAG: hypothetical protein ACI9IA_001634 [Enterobacterales bacterium]|jgi:hypothetical protein
MQITLINDLDLNEIKQKFNRDIIDYVNNYAI